MNIPGFVISVAEEEFEDAYSIIRDTNTFPGICGYICHHPCEDECLRSEIEDPISARSIRRFVVDQKLSKGLGKVEPIKPWKSKVAIVGSGPAGLTCAHDLAKNGYDITVFEALPNIGGMLTGGIPEFCLPRSVSEAEIDQIQALGIEIKTNSPIGKELSVDDLLKQGYKAVFVAVGAWKSLKLNVPGLDLDRVFTALPFLNDMNLGRAVTFAPSDKVLVVGGGNVGIDASRAALRLGATEVHLACLESRDEMPAFDWEIASAEEEGVIMHNSYALQEIVGKDGKVTGANFTGVKSIKTDEKGRVIPTLIEGSKNSLEATAVIIAIGQSLDPSVLEGIKGVDLDVKGNIAVNTDTLATNLPGVFAGGDAVVGAGTVVEAIAAGHTAASSIEHYLSGQEVKEVLPMQVVEVEKESIPKFLERRERVPMPRLSLRERLVSTKEVADKGYSKEEAMAEAKRCLSCPVCGTCMYERSQMCYETALRLL
jgi:NADPH-dependent glutamate synthase beta subunit-like oxidoreductase